MGVQLNQLIVSNIRNLQAIDLTFGPQFNVFTGKNGSGKTSLLEAIHLLGLGRSFRANSLKQIVTFGAKQCVVRAELNSSELQNNIWMAMERDTDGATTYKVGGQEEKSAAEMSKLLPIQLIDVNSHLLLEGGPIYRRQFIDWGVFHVEHNFINDWRALQRSLLQRNAVLKQRRAPNAVWNETFVKYAQLVDEGRKAYIQQFKQAFLPLIAEKLGLINVDLRYNRGWDPALDLHEVLMASLENDLQAGYTTKGPHRAELSILIENRSAKEVLSRGQLKTFVCMMLLARAQLLSSAQAGLFLIDDLHAELDKHSCNLFISAIKEMGCQVFITGIETALLHERLHGCATNMFHVEHGTIKELAVL